MLDQRIINKIQEAYLWFYDWTGVYAPTVAVSFFLLGKMATGFKLDPINIIITIFNIVVLIPSYLDQDKNRIATYNLRALAMQGLSFRLFFTAVILGFTVGEIVNLQFADAFYSFTLIMYIYMTVICIREREPKEWFKKPKLAMDYAS